MNLIFLTMSRMEDISRRGIYTDLMRKFRDEGHSVYIVTPYERSFGQSTGLKEEDGIYILGVKTLNLQKTNVMEKGIGQVLVEGQYKRAIKHYLSNVQFDLILYSTPPITFPKVIDYLRKRNPQAISYLLLKDIFPQNAVDLGLMSTSGTKGFLYKFFRNKERKLYALSDFIGCMSPANVDYILKHNKDIDSSHVEVAPNSITLVDLPLLKKEDVRKRYNLPIDRPIFIYGGNLGKPQGIPFLIDCLDANSNRVDCHFLIVGTGTELNHLQRWYDNKKPHSVTVMDGLPKKEYDELASVCDVGMIFLDYHFTIPNYPSRLLPYLENKMPVICATDPNTDIGSIAEQNGYGYWCESNSVDAFNMMLDKMIHSDRLLMGQKGYDYLCKNYQISTTYEIIVKHV